MDLRQQPQAPEPQEPPRPAEDEEQMTPAERLALLAALLQS